MEPKKSRGANLENKRGLFFQIGAVAALVIMIGVFSSSQAKKTIPDDFTPGAVTVDPDEPPITRDRTPENRIDPVIVNPTVFEVVPDDRDIRVTVDWEEFEENMPAPGPYERGPEGGINDEEDFIVVEDMPTFRGGSELEFRKWVMENISYPSGPAENGVQGRVVVTFVIDKEGNLTNIEVLSSPDRDLSNETIRVLNMSPKWEPGRQRNTPVRVRFNIPVDFQLK